MSITKSRSKLVSVGLYLEAEELETLRAAAKADGRSLSSYVRRLFFGDGCITTPAKKVLKSNNSK